MQVKILLFVYDKLQTFLCDNYHVSISVVDENINEDVSSTRSMCSLLDFLYFPVHWVLKPQYLRAGARDTVRLSFKPNHSRHDFLPTTTQEKVHRAGSTSVYCLCHLHEGIQHRWEDWTMAATEEIWMP